MITPLQRINRRIRMAEGRLSCRFGFGQQSNPYDYGSENYRHWLAGWAREKMQSEPGWERSIGPKPEEKGMFMFGTLLNRNRRRDSYHD